LKVYLQCDNDKEVQARKLPPPLAGGEKDLLIDCFAEMCRVECEKRFVDREYKCGKCKRDDVQRAKEKEAGDKGKGKGKDMGGRG
jgi:hypothetical protein